jgi:hypothetical protein
MFERVMRYNSDYHAEALWRLEDVVTSRAAEKPSLAHSPP